MNRMACHKNGAEDPLRVLVLTADAGFGHRSAANAIVAALQEEHGAHCVVEVLNPLEDRRALPLLRSSQSDYDRIVREVPELYKLGYEASDAPAPARIVDAALTVVLFEVMRDIVARSRPDVIVATYPLYQAPLRAVYLVNRRHIPLCTVVTDLATVHRLWFHEIADLCFVPTETVRELALLADIPASRVVITGIPVHPRLAGEKRPPAEIRAELGWQPERTTLLVVGSRRVGNLSAVLNVLNHTGLPLQLGIVAGGDDALFEQLQRVDWHLPTHLYNFVDNMPTLMHAADCILCKAGGLIVTEALACGLPLLLVDVLPGQETGNADYVRQGGAGALAEEPVVALETLYHWLANDGALLAHRAANARRLGRPRAAYDIAARVCALADEAAQTRPRQSLRGRSRLIDLLNRHGIHWRLEKEE